MNLIFYILRICHKLVFEVLRAIFNSIWDERLSLIVQGTLRKIGDLKDIKIAIVCQNWIIRPSNWVPLNKRIVGFNTLNVSIKRMKYVRQYSVYLIYLVQMKLSSWRGICVYCLQPDKVIFSQIWLFIYPEH